MPYKGPLNKKKLFLNIVSVFLYQTQLPEPLDLFLPNAHQTQAIWRQNISIRHYFDKLKTLFGQKTLTKTSS